MSGFCPMSVCPDSVCLDSVNCLDSVRTFRKKLFGRRTRTRQSCPDFQCPCPPTSDSNNSNRFVQHCPIQKAQENFDSATNNKFNLKQFRKISIRKVYDALHGISNDTVSLSTAVEIIAYCLIDGKVEQGSGFETDLYNDLVVQLKTMKDGFED